eukprot:4207606-Pyramimonas_sp.AAC.1
MRRPPPILAHPFTRSEALLQRAAVLRAPGVFKGPKLRDLTAFLRKLGKQVPPAIRATWNAMQLEPDDRRLWGD